MIFQSSKQDEPWFSMQITTIYIDGYFVMGCGVAPWGSIRMEPIQLYHADSNFGAVQAARMIVQYLLDGFNDFIKEPVWIHHDGEIQTLVEKLVAYVMIITEKIQTGT